MTLLSIWLSVVLSLLLFTGAFMWWYIRKLLAKFLIISQNIEDLAEMVENYQKHLKHVNNMETYNGDETIGYLLQHTQSLLDMLGDYRDVYGITEPLQTLEEIEEDDNRTTQAQEEASEANSEQISEENVFYAGARRRNN